ncbi:hypothetical protein E1A91_A02G058400v1, partial [Gossypium mustelinum]
FFGYPLLIFFSFPFTLKICPQISHFQQHQFNTPTPITLLFPFHFTALNSPTIATPFHFCTEFTFPLFDLELSIKIDLSINTHLRIDLLVYRLLLSSLVTRKNYSS